MEMFGFWFFLAAIVLGGQYFNQAKRASREKLLQSFLEKGAPIPPELLKDDEWHFNRQGKNGLLIGGVVMLCLSIGLGAFLWAMSSGAFGGPPDDDVQPWLPFVALVPGSIGVGLLLASKLTKRNSDTQS